MSFAGDTYLPTVYIMMEDGWVDEAEELQKAFPDLRIVYSPTR